MVYAAPNDEWLRALARSMRTTSASSPQNSVSRLAEPRLAITNAPAGMVRPATSYGSSVIRRLNWTGES